MAERWRRPAVVLNIEEVPDEGLWLPDGRIQGQLKLTLDAETVERMRLGYMCVKCMEPFERPWPQRCHVCGAPIATRQAEYFEKEFAGTEPLGPVVPLFDGRIHERAAEAEEKR